MLSGAATIEQIEANVTALAVPWDMTAAESLAGLAEDPGAYWQTRSTLAWN